MLCTSPSQVEMNAQQGSQESGRCFSDVPWKSEMGLREAKDSWSLGTFAWHQIAEAAEGGEGGLK